MVRKLVVASLRDQLVDLIQDAIITNQYLPGQELQIDGLAQQFGVSTTPIREALCRLEGAGLIVMVPNRAVQVTAISPQDVRDVWEMRRIMEPYAAAVAAEKCSREDIAEIRGVMNKVTADPGDLEVYMTSDFELHDLLLRYVTNQLFHRTLERVRKHSARIRYFAESGSEGRDEVVRQVTSEHMGIIEALKRHDKARASQLVFDHLTNGLGRTLAAVEARNRVIETGTSEE